MVNPQTSITDGVQTAALAASTSWMPSTATSCSPWEPWDGPRAATRAAVTRVHLGCDAAEELRWCRELSGHRPAGPTTTPSEEACAVPSDATGWPLAPCSVQCVAGLLTQRPATGWLVPAVCGEAASRLLGAVHPHRPAPACPALTGISARWHHRPRCSGASMWATAARCHVSLAHGGCRKGRGGCCRDAPSLLEFSV